MNQTYQTTQAAEYKALASFRNLIKRACQDHPAIDDQALYDLQLACDEACTNIIQHGYAGIDPGSIIFTLEVGDDQVFMVLTDFGHPFEPAEPPAPDLEAPLESREPGGFGLFFIYQTMDKVEYQATNCGNQLTLVKRLAK